MTEAKSSGLGDNFYIAGYDLSGDVSAITQLDGGPVAIDVTGIKYSANQRIGGLRVGDLQFTSFWDYDSVNLDQAFSALSGLPRTDVIASYFRGTTLLNPCASLLGRQLNYDPTRGTDGSLTMAVEVQSDGYGLEWGVMLTPGLRTDTEATTGTYVNDNGAASDFGAQAYWQLVAFTGTSVTIDINHCATDNGTYTNLMSSGAQTGIGAGRMSVSNTTTVDEYLEVTTVGTFSNAVFAVHWTRNPIAGITFGTP
jgi:hypothetical protein